MLLFLVPPLAGAIIGFVTNVVAIRMLFRPLREIRVLGIRLPFTPGILPRQRHRLAQSIGAMVERELITPEIVRERLSRNDVREKIKEALSLFTEKIYDKTPGELLAGGEFLPPEKISSAVEKLYPSFAPVVVDFLRRDEIRRELESKGRIFLRNVFLKLNVFQRFFLSAGQYDLTLEQRMPEIIDDLISNAREMLNDDRIKKTLTGAVTSSFSRVTDAQGQKIGALLNISETDKKKLDDFIFDKLMSAADGQIESILASVNVKALVSDRIDSLDMLRVERIILDVMSDQFKWIDIFGGILGFMIGTFQSLFSFFLR
jgi:uncharacterized membrane protein YheB (UPF0754 family)